MPAQPAEDRLPPFSIEAEESVLASILVDPDAIYKLQSILSPDDFFREQHKWVFEACLAIWSRDEPLNQVTVGHELVRRNRLEEAGGAAFLSRIVTDLPTAVGSEHYAHIVKRDSLYRGLIGATRQISQMAYEGGPEIQKVLSRAEELIIGLRSHDEVQDFQHVRALLEKYLEVPGIDSPATNSASAIRTGFIDLDTLLGGLKKTDLVIIAARPSLGKTSLALNIARNAALGQLSRVAIFSLEMSAEQLTQRLLASEAGIDSNRLRLGEHTEAEERKILHAMGLLAETEIYIDDTAVQRVTDIRAKAHRLHRERPLDLIVVDYLQLISGNDSRGANRVMEVSEISRALKGLARELNVTVIACSQLSRAPEQRSPHIPLLSDLRESGSIEQDADTVMMIYRDDVYISEEEWYRQNPERAYPEGIAQIIVAKHRNGPTGSVYLRFRKHLTRFEDIAVLDSYEV